MRTKKKVNETIDTLGTKWTLPPGAENFVNECQNYIWEIHIEIAGYAALFRNLNSCDFSASELYGVSLLLMRISKRLGRIHEFLEQTTQEESSPKKSN